MNRSWPCRRMNAFTAEFKISVVVNFGLVAMIGPLISALVIGCFLFVLLMICKSEERFYPSPGLILAIIVAIIVITPITGGSIDETVLSAIFAIRLGTIFILSCAVALAFSLRELIYLCQRLRMPKATVLLVFTTFKSLVFAFENFNKVLTAQMSRGLEPRRINSLLRVNFYSSITAPYVIAMMHTIQYIWVAARLREPSASIIRQASISPAVEFLLFAATIALWFLPRDF